MKKTLKCMAMGAVLLSTASCYEDYKFDFTYSATYFARQKPVRTLVEEDGKDFKFKFAAVLAGVYDNQKNWTVGYEIDPTLLTQYPDRTLLPAEYYTLSHASQMTVPKGDIIGEVEITIDRDQLMNDPKGLTGEYVLPLRITNSDMDSVLVGMDYSLISVKYINEYHGDYYLTGQDIKFDASGSPVDTVTYRQAEDEFVKNIRIAATSVSRYQVQVNYVGRFTSAGHAMVVGMDEKGEQVTLTPSESSKIKITSGAGTYDQSKRIFNYTYEYVDAEGFNHQVKDEVHYSNTYLKIEEW